MFKKQLLLLALLVPYGVVTANEESHHMITSSTNVAAHQIDTTEISRLASDLNAPLIRKDDKVTVDLYSDELVAEMMPGVTYQYWTYNDQVPAPFIRVKEGEQVEIRLLVDHSLSRAIDKGAMAELIISGS